MGQVGKRALVRGDLQGMRPTDFKKGRSPVRQGPPSQQEALAPHVPQLSTPHNQLRIVYFQPLSQQSKAYIAKAWAAGPHERYLAAGWVPDVDHSSALRSPMPPISANWKRPCSSPETVAPGEGGFGRRNPDRNGAGRPDGNRAVEPAHHQWGGQTSQ